MFFAPEVAPPPAPSSGLEQLQLPLMHLRDVSRFDALLNYPPVKALLPIPIILAIAPVIWWFFRDTWKRLDEEAAELRAQTAPGSVDYRPAACMLITAVVLTLQE